MNDRAPGARSASSVTDLDLHRPRRRRHRARCAQPARRATACGRCRDQDASTTTVPRRSCGASATWSSRPARPRCTGYPDLNVISNVGRTTPPRSSFHVDTSYVREPPAYTALRAVTVPAQGGETLFTNQYRAYETLPDRGARPARGRTVAHVVTGSTSAPTRSPRPSTRCSARTRCRAAPRSTSRRRSDAWRSAGWTTPRPTEMIATCYAHSTPDGQHVRHAWAPGRRGDLGQRLRPAQGRPRRRRRRPRDAPRHGRAATRR